MASFTKFVRKQLFKLLVVLKQIIAYLAKLKNAPIIIPVVHHVLSMYYYYFCGLVPCTVDLDDQTSLHFWISKHRHHDRPNLVLIHGCGGDARWQFLRQMGTLSKSFNIYMPDLIFFGDSYSKSMDRTLQFQAKSLMEGLKRGFGVEKCTVCSVSYGGWVGYRMAQMFPREVEKVMIVSAGIGSSMDQKQQLLREVGMPVEKFVIPGHPDTLKMLIKRSVHKRAPTLLPNFFLWSSIRAIDDRNRQEKEELIQHLMSEDADSELSTLSQDTLLVWGDQDKFFPTPLAYQLQRLLGPKARVEIVKDAGHAVNIDCPNELNQLIRSFTLD